MIKYSPFLNISTLEITEIRACLNSKTKIYKKNEIIMRMSDANDVLYIVESAHLLRIDVDGNKSIIDYYETEDVFGQMLTPNSEKDTYYVTAKEKCEITTLDYNKLMRRCNNNCEKHSIFLNNLLYATLEKSQMHIDVLSQRTTRQKLLTYFDYLSMKNSSANFTLPLSLSDLADYLSVDRSAMMREIKKIKSENIISVNKNKITLHKSRYGI